MMGNLNSSDRPLPAKSSQLVCLRSPRLFKDALSQHRNFLD